MYVSLVLYPETETQKPDVCMQFSMFGHRHWQWNDISPVIFPAHVYTNREISLEHLVIYRS